MANLFDSANIAEREPALIRAGDLLQWKRTDLGVDYANSAYTLKYSARLEGTGSTEIEITASASGDDYLVSVSKSTTANYTVGVYHWQAYITRNSDSERITIDSGTWRLSPTEMRRPRTRAATPKLWSRKSRAYSRAEPTVMSPATALQAVH